MSIDVLVVDDDMDMRTTLIELLVDEGYDVEALSGAQTLLKVINERRPKLVLLDLTMPGFDVASTARLMHEQGVLNQTRVVALSGLDQIHELVDEYGFHGALPKPFELDDLFALITDVLEPGSKKSTPSGDTMHP